MQQSQSMIKITLLIALFLHLIGCQSMNNVSKTMNKDQKLNHLDYLENVEGSEALTFAKKHNAFSDSRLKTDKRYQSIYNDVFKIVSSKINYP